MKHTFIIIILAVLILIASCASSNQKPSSESSSHLSQQATQITNAKEGLEKGNSPPDFTITSTENQQINLHSFAKENKPVLLYFMATWCPFCAQDFKALSMIYSEYKDKVPIIAISLDLTEDSKTLSEYKKKYPLLDSVVFASGKPEIIINYKVTHTTTKYALGKNGNLIYAGSGAFTKDQWKTLLDALVNS